MNILVIGNGFDLAHGLPTRYGDFLMFCRMIERVYFVDYYRRDEKLEDVWKELKIKKDDNKIMKETFDAIFSCRKISIFDHPQDTIDCTISINVQYDEFYKCIYNNIWIGYFKNHSMYQKEGWIDFENEISKVIRSIDDDMRTDGINENTIISSLTETYLAGVFLDSTFERENEIKKEVSKQIKKLEKQEGRKWHLDKKIKYLQEYLEKHPVGYSKGYITYKQLIKKLEEDLNKLIRALEIYLVEYVEKIECNRFSVDIQENNYDAILSFNYTNTYTRLYSLYREPAYDYIHGKADLSHTIETNNMVLGVDEYLSKKRKNKNTDFITFKKFYQRIYKKTGCEYKDWIDDIKKDNLAYVDKIRKCEMEIANCFESARNQLEIELNDMKHHSPKHNVFIFGHSLDVTDRDVLRDLILIDNVYTCVFYRNKEQLGQQIANLVKVIGQDELIRRTGGSTKTIEFKLQQDMVERE